MLLEDSFNITINSGIVRYVDENAVRIVPINAFLKDQVKDLIKEVSLMLKSPKIPEINKNENKCKNCSLKEICHSKDIIQKRKA